MKWTDRMSAAGRGLVMAAGMLTWACGGTSPTWPSAPPPPPGPTYTLTGTVTENTSNGAPVAGAVVTHVSSGRTSTTDAAGTYTITGVAQATTTVTARKDGYLITSRTVSISGETRLDLVLNRTPPSSYVIVGLVSERVGSGAVPVEGVEVEDAYSHRSAITGPDGRYRIVLTATELGRSDGFVQFWARKPGFVPAVLERAVWEDTSIDFEIGRQ